MNQLLHGDCLQHLRTLKANSLDSLVTDPPAGIGFMGKSWDSDKGGRDQWIAWLADVMRECYRVLKPGAHGLVWALPRTSHWTATALEDAGFEVRDVITHLFGSGFPKSHDVSKAIDKAAGAERPVVGKGQWAGRGAISADGSNDGWKRPSHEQHTDRFITAPATDDARQWQGYGTALKPASEHWILIRKPLSEKTVAANVLKHGTGGINIDGCRIGTTDKFGGGAKRGTDGAIYGKFDTYEKGDGFVEGSSLGRFPANLVLSHNDDCELVGTKKVKPGNGSGRAGKGANGFRTEYVGGVKDADGFTGGFVSEDGTETVEAWQCTEGCAVRMLDEQSLASGMHSAGAARDGSTAKVAESYNASGYELPANRNMRRLGDSGGASRFYYVAKASKSDRGEGNTHPTVKSTKLMEYLVRLVTPAGGTVIDPFMGSGSTGVAAKREGFGFVGIERDPDYLAIAQKRTAI